MALFSAGQQSKFSIISNEIDSISVNRIESKLNQNSNNSDINETPKKHTLA